MTTKKISVNKKTYTIKQLTPLDFIELDNIPFSFFSTDESAKTSYQSYLAKLESEKKLTADETAKRMSHIAIILGKGIISPRESVGALIVDEPTVAMRLYAEVIDFATTKFKKQYKITTLRTYLIDRMAERYGKTPIEIECPEGGYTELEAWMFNAFVFSVSFNHQVEQEKKAIEKLKARR
jgi:hypothetical protein